MSGDGTAAQPHPQEESKTVVVDSRGHPCPQPIIDLARAVADLPAGTEVSLLSDDPAAPGDVQAWCRMRGHTYVGAAAAPPRAAFFDLRINVDKATQE